LAWQNHHIVLKIGKEGGNLQWRGRGKKDQGEGTIENDLFAERGPLGTSSTTRPGS